MLLVPTALALLASASAAAALAPAAPAYQAVRMERRLNSAQKAAASKSSSLSRASASRARASASASRARAAASKSRAAASASRSVAKASSSLSRSKAVALRSAAVSKSLASVTLSKSKASASKAAASASKAAAATSKAPATTSSSSSSASPTATSTGTSGSGSGSTSGSSLPADDASYDIGCYSQKDASGSYLSGPRFAAANANACTTRCESYAAYMSTPPYTAFALTGSGSATYCQCLNPASTKSTASLVASSAPATDCNLSPGYGSDNSAKSYDDPVFVAAWDIDAATAASAYHAALVALSSSGGLKETPPTADSGYTMACMSGVALSPKSGSGRAPDVHTAFASLCPAFSDYTTVVALQAFPASSPNGNQDGVSYASAKCLTAKTLSAVAGTVVDKSLCDSPLYGSADGATYFSVFELPKNTTVIA